MTVSLTPSPQNLLVLDLDETLVHSREGVFQFPPELKSFLVYEKDGSIAYTVCERPHLHAFLDSCEKHYRIAIWTAASEDYATQIVQTIFAQRTPPLFVWSGSRCTRHFCSISGEDDSVKRMKKVFQKTFTEDKTPLRFSKERCLILDDRAGSAKKNYGNYLPCKPFEGCPNTDNNYLVSLAEYLQEIKDVPDFRRLEKRHLYL